MTNLFLDVNGEEILWEPGVVSYENLEVKNVGTLALNYALSLNFYDENDLYGYKLSQILKVGFVEGVITSTNRADVVASVTEWTSLETFAAEGSLLPGASDTCAIVIWWEPGDQDNNWNANNNKDTSNGEPLQIDFGVKLVATQMMYEEDSFDNTYDKDATPAKVSSIDELKAALAAGAKNIDAAGAVLGEISNDVTFGDGVTLKNATFEYIYGTDLEGTVTFENCNFTTNHSYSCHFDGGNGQLIFNNCVFDGWNSFGDVVTNIEMNNCTFKNTYPQYSNGLRFYQNAQLNNCVVEAGFESIDTNVTGTVIEFTGCTGIDGKIHNNSTNIGVWIVDGVDISSTVASW